MSDHEGRSCASPPTRRRERWTRPDVARPGPQDAPEGAAELDPPGDLFATLDPPEALHAAEVFGLLPQAARRSIMAGLGEVRS